MSRMIYAAIDIIKIIARVKDSFFLNDKTAKVLSSFLSSEFNNVCNCSTISKNLTRCCEALNGNFYIGFSFVNGDSATIQDVIGALPNCQKDGQCLIGSTKSVYHTSKPLKVTGTEKELTFIQELSRNKIKTFTLKDFESKGLNTFIELLTRTPVKAKYVALLPVYLNDILFGVVSAAVSVNVSGEASQDFLQEHLTLLAKDIQSLYLSKYNEFKKKRSDLVKWIYLKVFFWAGLVLISAVLYSFVASKQIYGNMFKFFASRLPQYIYVDNVDQSIWSELNSIANVCGSSTFFSESKVEILNENDFVLKTNTLLGFRRDAKGNIIYDHVTDLCAYSNVSRDKNERMICQKSLWKNVVSDLQSINIGEIYHITNDSIFRNENNLFIKLKSMYFDTAKKELEWMKIVISKKTINNLHFVYTVTKYKNEDLKCDELDIEDKLNRVVEIRNSNI